MILYDWKCLCGFSESTWADVANRDTIRPSHNCGKSITRQPGGRGLLYFEEARARKAIGLGGNPITSKKQHERMMKAAGVVEMGDNLPKQIRDNPQTLGMQRRVEKDAKGRWL